MKTSQRLSNLLSSTIHLFYPNVCAGCTSDAISDDNLLCLNCITGLPHTNFAEFKNNPIEKIFFGRTQIVAAHSEFYFAKETLIQHLIHQLKYKNNTAIGFYLGQVMGNSLLSSNRFNNIDYLIPLPLYADREKKRGYNQSTIICNGIADIMQIPVLQNNILRQKFTETQTLKHRDERWQNVEGSFIVKNPSQLKNKNILLVDDVITTGATLEACASTLTQVEGLNLFIATLAHVAK